MIETLQSFPWPIQIVFAVVFAAFVVLSGVIVGLWWMAEMGTGES